jgi:hypothetical protein
MLQVHLKLEAGGSNRRGVESSGNTKEAHLPAI